MDDTIGRRTVIVIENDEIGDGEWNPLVVASLRAYADYAEETRGAGNFPQIHLDGNGNKITVYAGTCIGEEQQFIRRG